MRSVMRAIRKFLLAKILAHVKLKQNLEEEEDRICPEKIFREGCLSFFLYDVLQGQSLKGFEAKRVIELLKIFLNLQCDQKFAFIAAKISNMAYSDGAKKSKRCLGRKLVAPLITFRVTHIRLIAKNKYSNSFCKYLQREVNHDLFNSEHG